MGRRKENNSTSAAYLNRKNKRRGGSCISIPTIKSGKGISLPRCSQYNRCSISLYYQRGEETKAGVREYNKRGEKQRYTKMIHTANFCHAPNYLLVLSYFVVVGMYIHRSTGISKYIVPGDDYSDD